MRECGQEPAVRSPYQQTSPSPVLNGRESRGSGTLSNLASSRELGTEPFPTPGPLTHTLGVLSIP